MTLTDISEAQATGEKTLVAAKKKITEDYILKFKGKSLAVLEAVNYIKSSPQAFLLGAGAARFSSLTAQKMAGFDSSRLFMSVLPQFRSPEYEENHMLIIQARKEAESKYFSNANWPDSFFTQLLSEYGIIGLLLFLFTYVFYFLKKFRYWSYGLWMFLMVLPFAHMTYLFEPLCVIVFFELLMEADIKENLQKAGTA